MRTETHTVSVGELLGPIDWSYNFRSHYNGNDVANTERRFAHDVSQLRDIEVALRAGKAVEATTDGGWPRVGWCRVLEVGMYDGWPYWRPVPSVLLSSPLGPEWHSFLSITEARIK